MILRTLAPAGAPIRVSDLGRWAAQLVSLRDAEAALAGAIRSRVHCRHAFITSTGRAGLTVLLSGMRELAGAERNEVVLPSYTCYSVAASIARAGCRLRIVDVDRRYLDFDLKKLEEIPWDRVLAVVSTSLYGLPGRMRRIAELAREHRVFLVDDAAQSFGAFADDRPSGTWGDAGLFSLDKGKNVSAIDGGVLVTNSDAIAQVLQRRIGGLPAPSIATTSAQLIKVGVYSAFLSPSLYWLPNSLPGLKLGQTAYDPDFVIERQSAVLAALGRAMLPRLDAFQTHRLAVAERLRAELSRVRRISLFAPVPESRPAYLRFPILADTPALRDEILSGCGRAGLGASGSYPGSVADIPAIRDRFAGPPDASVGRDIAKRLVTLPTHPYVTDDDVRRTVAIIDSSCRTLP